MNAAVIETHPGPNDLAAFAEGTLGEKEYRVVEVHLADCAECKDEVLTAAEMAEPVPFWRPMWVPAAILAAAAAIAGVVFLTPAGDPVMRWKNARALTKAVATLDERPVAGRLSFQTEYKRHNRPRGADDGVDDDALGNDALGNLEAMVAATESFELAQKHPTFANLYAAGVAMLATDDLPFQREGVDHLERALRKHTSRSDIDAAIEVATDANLLNDLAAGYEDTSNVRARKTIERAWALDNRSLPIAWTRAQILQTRAAFEDYLRLDSTSEWSVEAKRDLEYSLD